MIIPIELRFKADKGSKSAFRTEKTIKSHDVNSIEFHISIEGLELTDNYTAKILSVFHSSKSQVNVDCEIVDGKIIYKPDTSLISRHEHVTNYVYVYHNNQSLDVCEFLYIVDLSKVDETSLEVKEVYDQSYANLLADFEQALSDYKDSLPQADSVRADIDEILNQFSEDSQAKLSQYDADLARLDSEKANRKQEVWIAPTLLNGWTNFGGVYESVSYMKDEFGFVHIRGMVKGGSVGQNIFFLPEGYRPLKSQYHICIASDIPRTLNVQAVGGVLVALAASNAWVTLNGISFKAEA